MALHWDCCLVVSCGYCCIQCRMEPPATVEAVSKAAQCGDLPALRRLLAAAPGLALAGDEDSWWGQSPLSHAAHRGQEAAVRLLLEAAPAAAHRADRGARLPLHWAACGGNEAIVQLLLGAAPEACMAADSDGCLPLHLAAQSAEREGVMALLLAAASAGAVLSDSQGMLPLHKAAIWGSEAMVRLLLEVAPAAASCAALSSGVCPLHCAAASGNSGAVQLLAEAAPAAAALCAGIPPALPLEIALQGVARRWRGHNPRADYTRAARLLLPATPLDDALSALAAAGEAAQPFYPSLVAGRPLSHEQWRRVPAPCSGLAAALPAVLERSEAQAGWLVERLPMEERERLRTAALSLARAQRLRRMHLPAALVGRVLALAAGP